MEDMLDPFGDRVMKNVPMIARQPLKKNDLWKTDSKFTRLAPGEAGLKNRKESASQDFRRIAIIKRIFTHFWIIQLTDDKSQTSTGYGSTCCERGRSKRKSWSA